MIRPVTSLTRCSWDIPTLCGLARSASRPTGRVRQPLRRHQLPQPQDRRRLFIVSWKRSNLPQV
jgi:hypothetical protein